MNRIVPLVKILSTVELYWCDTTVSVSVTASVTSRQLECQLSYYLLICFVKDT